MNMLAFNNNNNNNNNNDFIKVSMYLANNLLLNISSVLSNTIKQCSVPSKKLKTELSICSFIRKLPHCLEKVSCGFDCWGKCLFLTWEDVTSCCIIFIFVCVLCLFPGPCCWILKFLYYIYRMYGTVYHVNIYQYQPTQAFIKTWGEHCCGPRGHTLIF